LKLPPDRTVEATGPDGATVTYPASASDAQDGALTPKCGPVSGSVFPLGTTTVNCSVTDGGGLTATGSFNVTVQDTTPPSLTLPPDQTDDESTSRDGVTVTYTATAADRVDGPVTPSCSPASRSFFRAGITTMVNCSATDAHGNTATGSFTITVVYTG
jgi:HYR domain